MRHKEEIEFSINNFRLFDKAVIHVCTLRWVKNLLALNFEESLSHSFVNDNQGNMRKLLIIGGVIFVN